LTELESTGYEERTRKNVEASDLIVIYSRPTLTGGTLLTFNIARECTKHVLCLPLEIGRESEFYHLLDIAGEQNPNLTVMFAGPRESRHPGIFSMGLSRFYPLLLGAT